MASSIENFYPRPSKELLCEAFMGKHLKELPTPAAVLDRAIVERNCCQMLDSCKSLGVRFRAHVKTHKVISSSFSCSLVQQPIRSKLSCAQSASLVHFRYVGPWSVKKGRMYQRFVVHRHYALAVHLLNGFRSNARTLNILQ